MLGLAAVSPPGQLPQHIRDREASLIRNVRVAEADGEDEDTSTPAAQSVAGEESSRELNRLWDEVADIAPEYLDLRRGRPMAFAELRAWVGEMTDATGPH